MRRRSPVAFASPSGGGVAALALALALAGACRRPPPPPPSPPPPPDAAVARPAIDAAPVEPDLCHASVGWRAGSFEIVGLPCVTRDGNEILFAKSEDRPGSPDLTVVAVTRADQVSRQAIVMEPHERGELLDAARNATPALQERIVRANVLLADASARAVPLAPFAPTAAGTHAGQGLELAWTERGRLTISRGGHFVHGGDHGHWLEKLAACEPPSYLEQVWGDAARGVLLVKIAYRGSGGCTAPPELHVVSWSPQVGAP